MKDKRMFVPVITSVLLCLGLLFPAASARADAIVADHSGVAEFASIPDSVIEDVRADYQFFYGHTSHGSQIMTGLGLLADEDPLYTKPTFHEYGDDLGHNGDTSWVPPTRNYLNSHPDCNVVMWSWCGGCSDNTEEGINIYLNAMNGLEQDYPDVTFIYMTGHLDGTGPDGNLYAWNNQIRAYCADSGKVLFDFADIESWDPDGNYYPDESDGCSWCYTWCSSHSCPSCGCAHSHCLNCYLKGKGFWWMMARVSGWPGSQGITEDNPTTPRMFSLSQNYPNPFNPVTEIKYTLPRDCFVKLEIYNIFGQKVISLVDGKQKTGYKATRWDASFLSSGIYLYRLQAGDFVLARRMILIR